MLGIIAIIMTGLAEILAKPLASIFVSYDKELLEIVVSIICIVANRKKYEYA